MPYQKDASNTFVCVLKLPTTMLPIDAVFQISPTVSAGVVLLSGTFTFSDRNVLLSFFAQSTLILVQNTHISILFPWNARVPYFKYDLIVHKYHRYMQYTATYKYMYQ